MIPYGRQILCVDHYLKWIDLNTNRSGNTRARGRGDPSSNAGEDQSGGNSDQIDLAHLSSPVHRVQLNSGHHTSLPYRPDVACHRSGIVCIAMHRRPPCLSSLLDSHKPAMLGGIFLASPVFGLGEMNSLCPSHPGPDIQRQSIREEDGLSQRADLMSDMIIGAIGVGPRSRRKLSAIPARSFSARWGQVMQLPHEALAARRITGLHILRR